MKRIIQPLLLAWIPVLSLSSCRPAAPPPTAAREPTAAPTENPEPWRQILSLQAPPLIQLSGFFDASFGITIGDDSSVQYTEDGGADWQPSEISALQLFGLDIVDRNTAWACGNGAVRVTTDGAKTWQAAANFGAANPDHCRFISFLDARTGWAATSAKLATTSDGASTWTDLTLPEGADRIAAVSLFGPGRGFLLTQSGLLFSTADDGKTWSPSGAPPLAALTIADMVPPVAALRFADALHGVIIIPSVGGGSSRVVSFHTADGGANWTQETVADVFGFPVISHDGRILTLYATPSMILVYQYIAA
jgi:photosystem II stability/assembly factor-like uncharacterized protein